MKEILSGRASEPLGQAGALAAPWLRCQRALQLAELLRPHEARLASHPGAARTADIPSSRKPVPCSKEKKCVSRDLPGKKSASGPAA